MSKEKKKEMSQKCYAVAFGHKRGIYEKWPDCQKQINGFPQPVYKKFESRTEAQEFFDNHQPTSVTFDVNKKGKVFYAIARGKVAGIFDDFKTVKEHISGFDRPLYKKFATFDEAKEYYEKFANGIISQSNNDTNKGQKVSNKSPTKAIARKRTHANVENSNDDDDDDNDNDNEDNDEDNNEKDDVDDVNNNAKDGALLNDDIDYKQNNKKGSARQAKKAKRITRKKAKTN